ncbi:hypothetical protein GA0116948_102103 [Chitinophaga costaii]|uniref:Uncharacterized protein n=1 Tax=Chitinophaga costaii TaxID=1335309 RepID=A0A1C4AF30_9BACT|nr:hypothetical protein [Chitinophaga costaii]PUZ26578.1 hypothetical protein DCM91_09200 [Chitinophaga costaii]SCB93145.1 hypothetical protein GA0116948_102103 [Chitinophaga costaii]
MQKVTPMDALEQEIIRLKKHSRVLEQELGERATHFKSNFKGMAVNSIVPSNVRKSGAMGIVGRVARLAWESGKIKSFATTALMSALEYVGVRAGVNLYQKFTNRKKDK